MTGSQNARAEGTGIGRNKGTRGHSSEADYTAVSGSRTTPSLENLPTGMVEADRWLLWTADKRPWYADGRPRQGTLDSEADIACLADLETALAALRAHPDRYAGLGFALGPDGLGDYWQGIDLDKVADHDLGDIVAMLPGYVERSPSGKGLHAIGLGAKFRTLGSNDSGIEAYCKGRYFTVTGDVVRNGALVDLAPFVDATLEPRHRVRADEEGPAAECALTKRQLQDLREALFTLPAEDYDLWIATGQRLKALGAVGRGLWMAWSASQRDKFDDMEAIGKWNSFSGERTGYQAIFKEAQSRGWNNPGREEPPPGRPEDYGPQEGEPEKEPPDPVDEWVEEPLEAAAEGRFERIFVQTPKPPPVLIHQLIPRDVFGLVGAGGTAKSTFVLWLMIHVIIGRGFSGRPIYNHGPCLYISQEDPRDTIEYRIRKLCDAMDLGESHRRLVANQLHIEDWTGQMRRYVQADREGNLSMTRWVDAIGGKYGEAGIRLMASDPTVFFGPGERYVNDAEASLMQAGRRISRSLGGAAVGYVHHTGKTVTRDGIVDQYAGRGGSSFADNSRAMLIMTGHGKDDDEYPRPTEIDDAAVEDGRAFRLHSGKFSAGPRERQPLWILRGSVDPWHFKTIEVDNPADVRAVRKQDAERRDMYNVLEFVRLHQNTMALTARSLRDQDLDVPDKRIRRAVAKLIQEGYLTEEKLPAELRKGGRTMGLRATGARLEL